MPAKPSCEIKTSTVKLKQKNGDYYVVERKIRYNPDTKNNQILSSKLIGKIPAGSQKMVLTRPRRTKSDTDTAEATQGSASRVHAGMMDILEHVGKESGIDDLLYDNADIGTAQKIISIARYLAATDGDTLPGIESFQLMHNLPYAEGITEDICHELFHRVGCDETLQQAFFMGRAKGLGEHPALAFDSTSVSTYSRGILEAKYGYAKDSEGLPVVKFIVFYSVFTRQPVAFWKLDGHVADVTTIVNALKRLSVLGIRNAELVADNGYYAEYNIADMCKAGLRFITLVQTRYKWVREAIDAVREELDTETTAAPFDRAVHGVCVPKMRTFHRPRLYASRKKGLETGAMEAVTKRTYLHVYFDKQRKLEEDTAFDNRIHDVRDLLLEGAAMSDLSTPMQSLARKYLIIKTRAGKTIVAFNEEAIKEYKKYTGFFALLANHEKDAFRCLKIYRRRELIEEFFRQYKGAADDKRPRVWSGDTLQGRMFVQFIALCYREYLAVRIVDLKASLGVPNGDPLHDNQDNLGAEKKLRSWLKERSLNQILRWFEPGDRTDASTPVVRKRFAPEIMAQDALFLTKIGMRL